MALGVTFTLCIGPCDSLLPSTPLPHPPPHPTLHPPSPPTVNPPSPGPPIPINALGHVPPCAALFNGTALILG